VLQPRRQQEVLQDAPPAQELRLDEEEPGGNAEGKELRFGPAASGLWAASTTGTSNGSVNSMHDSYTPLGGMVAMSHMLLGEVSPGGVGVGLNGLLVMVILAVFIAGLMVGRTPEYLGKKIQAAEMKLTSLHALLDMVDARPLGPEFLSLFDPGGGTLAGLDTPADVDAAEKALTARRAG